MKYNLHADRVRSIYLLPTIEITKAFKCKQLCFSFLFLCFDINLFITWRTT